MQLLIDSSGENGGFDVRTLSDAVNDAVVVPRFRYYEEAIAEVDKAVRDIMEGNTNISTQQIICNREINTFLKNKTLE